MYMKLLMLIFIKIIILIYFSLLYQFEILFEIRNLNKPFISKEIESIIKNLPTK